MQTVLVAGGAGFIGTALCEALLKKGYKVTCVDNFITSSEKNIHNLKSNPNFSFLEQDITQPFEIDHSIDAIFHLASPASPNFHSKISYHALPEETMLANTVGTRLLLNLAKKHNARFLFTSSSEVYGDPLEHPQKEEYRGNVSTTGPRSVYDESKRFGETMTAYFGRQHHLNVRIARIFNTYGPRMMREDKRMIISFITEAILEEPITIFGDGTQTRSLCYIDDLVEGLIKLMWAEVARGEIVNLGSEDEQTVLEYAKLVKELTNSKSEIVFNEDLPEDDPTKRRPNIDKARELLSWEPKVTLADGLKRTIEYVRENS